MSVGRERQRKSAKALVVLLLCGGDKSTQEQDIRKAQEYWEEYERQ